MNKYEIFELEKTEITVDVSMLFKEDSMFFNATEISKNFGKQPSEFLRGESAKSYISALISVKSDAENLRIDESDLVKTKRGGRYQGTWLHQDLSLHFARWLSPVFAVKLDLWVKGRLKEEEQRRHARLASKTGYFELSLAVMNDHEPAKGYHFSNEANLINRIVLGMDAKKFKELHEVENIRDSLTEFQIRAIKELQEIDTVFIKTGMEYQDRKDKLTEYYNKNILF